MRRWLSLLVIFLAVILGVLLIPQIPSAPPQPTFVLRFIGFTNTGTRDEALFYVSNPPPWHLLAPQEVTKKGSKVQAGRNYFGSGLSVSASASGGLIVGVWVETTNEPSRIVLRYQQSSTGLRATWENFLEARGRQVHRRDYFVTNETSIVAPRE
jgi:hypothetical protein